jgi:hypothetical protein
MNWNSKKVEEKIVSFIMNEMIADRIDVTSYYGDLEENGIPQSLTVDGENEWVRQLYWEKEKSNYPLYVKVGCNDIAFMDMSINEQMYIEEVFNCITKINQ